MTIKLELVAKLAIKVDAPVVLARTNLGERRMVAILSGRCEGPKLNADVLPGGTDYQVIRPDGVAVLEARYALRTDDGADIFVTNVAYRHAAPGVLERMMAGEDVPPEQYYFRTSPRFETADPRYAWLERTIFVAEARRTKDAVEVDVYAVL